MRILVVGAGAIGGYLGGRLLEARQDVTFLVRPARAAALAERGLQIKSPRGDLHWPDPPTVLADQIREPFDLVLLSCKAFDLDGAIEAFAPAVGPQTAILPFLNGMAHMDALEKRFGGAAVLGGVCIIATTLDPEGRILHLAEAHSMTFGERDGQRTQRIAAIEKAFAEANIDVEANSAIMQAMWDKWVFITTGMGINSLLRAPIGDIVAGGAGDLAIELLKECEAVVARVGLPASEAAKTRNRTLFTAAGSPMTTSMLRDIERGNRTEVDHVIGDMLGRGRAAGIATPVLRTAFAHVKTYEARRLREATTGRPS